MNGNPFYAEMPANKTFGKDKDYEGRGRGNESQTIRMTPTTKAKVVRKVALENSLVEKDVEEESTAPKW